MVGKCIHVYATDGSPEIEEDYLTERVENLLGPVSTRNLLVCFLWVIRSVDKDLLSNWWFTLSITRLDALLNVLDLCVSCFEYRGKRHLTNQPSNIGTPSKGSDVKSQLASAILHGEGSARERLRMRKAQAQLQAQADVLRWGKTYWQAASEHTDRPKVDVEVDAKIEGSLAAEASLIVLDNLEWLVQTLSLEGQAMLGRTLEVLLHLMGTNQSTEVMRNIFATQRAIVGKFPELVFEDETELCAELCIRLLRHCSSDVAEVRALACSSIYLLMRQNYNELGSNFARVKVQLTVALSSIVAGTSTFNEHHLRRSLKTLITYVQNDAEMKDDESFCEQVRELSLNLHRILLDTVKMQEFQDDPEMLMDLMYRISKGYQDSPDLRLTWLQHMADKHISRQNYTEAAMCSVHAAALVAEYLYLLEGRPHLPIGCVAFQKLSPNVLEESAVSDDLVSPEEDGICTSKSFSEQGLVDLLESAASFFFEDQVYEAVNEVYKLIIPIYESQLNHIQLGKVYVKLSDSYKEVVSKGQHRFLCSYFRVGFYGLIFGDLDGHEFIYREAALTRLGEFSLRLQKLYQDKLGDGKIELIKDSGIVDPAMLSPSKGYLQITYVEPYFDEWEDKKRTTVYDRFFNIRRFAFNTPFTPSGKAHGDVTEQYMRKTILTSMECFPYVKKRSEVVKLDTIELPPLEVAILGMQEKIESLKHILNQIPPDAKLLQMQLQGGIATSVNQGPFHIANSFLNIPPDQHTYHHRKLKVCFKEFTKRCWEALELNKKLITEEQKDYQKELMSNFKLFCDKLEPMVSTKKKHKRSRDRALINIAGAGGSRTSRQYSSSLASTETN